MVPYKINFSYSQIWIFKGYKRTIFISSVYHQFPDNLIELFPFRLRQISIFYDAIYNIIRRF